MLNKNKVVLVILDGWGQGKAWGGNAITIAQTPNYNKLIREYPNTTIKASGSDVGLPGHEVGNSEVGHMNLGAGNVVEQDIFRINKTIEDGSFYRNPILTKAIIDSKNQNTAVHLMGIVSDGGIHSHIVHLLALLKLCSILHHPKVYIHMFTDGRDTDPYKGIEFASKVVQAIEALKTGKIATVMGRLYLDRKGYWPRTQKAYAALVDNIGIKEDSALSAISAAYKNGESDEFISPRIIDSNGRIKSNDTVIFFNFRSDRTRQLTQAFLDPKFDKFKRTPLSNLNFITFIPYGVERELGLAAKPAFESIKIENTLGKYFEKMNLRQFHIAETEKFAHVTYFFNGNLNTPYEGEERMLIPSPNVRSYAEKPEMSAEEVKNELIKHIKRDSYSFIICNFANPDMVGHTGNFKAAVKAVEFLDKVIKEVTDCCVSLNTPLIFTADHGNIEQMVDPIKGTPDTEHTRNPVPLIIVSENKKISLRKDGRLANVAATCLDIAEFDIPDYFDPSLIEKNAQS